MKPTTFEGIADGADAIRRWILVNEDKIPEHLQQPLVGLTNTGASPVDLTMKFAEAVYAQPKKFPAEARHLAAAAAIVGATHGFHGMGAAARGDKIARVLRGEKVDNPPEVAGDVAAPVEAPAEEPK